jgi:S-formylglutathione hydrolase FrmB
VLLLLHGRGGFYQDWTDQGGVVERTEEHEVIVVSPDGGAGSFYSNANFPLPGREAAWESFIIDQVLPFVHANFRTSPDRMAIGGLSMGGWGALALGQRYWGHFRSVSSYSGPADCDPASPDGAAVAGAIWVCPAFDLEKYWGTTNLPGATWGNDLYPQIARGYNPMDNIETYRGKRVFLRTGDGPWLDFFEGLEQQPDLQSKLGAKLDQIGADIIENVVHPNLERFAGALGDAGIEHDYALVPGATHEWGLWRENLAEDLPGMMRVLTA